MLTRATVALCVVGLSVSVWGQPAAPAGSSEFPYDGAVTGENVYVRSGPALSYYRCRKLSRPAWVRVVGKQGNWLKILPPAGVFSAISKQYVRPDETGKVGTVTTNNVRVRAGGDLRPHNFGTVQTHLNRGAKVRILGEVENYYTIAPPAGAYLWISARYVRRVGAGEAVPPERVPRTATAPTHRRGPAVETPEEFNAAVKAYQAAEAALQAEYSKPADQRDLDGVRAMFRAIPVVKGGYIEEYVQAQIKFLTAAIQQMEELKAIKNSVAQAVQRHKQVQADLQKVDLEATSPPAQVFTAEGILLESVTFPGGPAAPKRYMLCDSDGHIRAYVQCTSSAVELSQHVDKLVGVIGIKRYDRDLRVDLVEAEAVKVVQEDVKLPALPEPKVGPIPKPPPPPEPKPEVKPPPEPKPEVKPPPEPKPEVKPPPEPTTQPAPEPTTQPERPVRPIFPAPPPEPEPEPAEPEPETQPSEPLPPYGLPIAEPTT